MARAVGIDLGTTNSVVAATREGAQAEVIANLMPQWTAETARQWFMKEAETHPRRSLVKTLALVVPERLADALCTAVAADARTPAAQVSRGDRERLLTACVHLPLPVKTDRGWNYAEVTAGGVPLEEVNYQTMESKMVPGLYLIGEILDCDGRIGGFNFQWAWATGYLAGRAAMRDST